MTKIFKYELRRLLLSKSFLGILAVTLFSAWLTLTRQTVLGVAHTAPFSPWSFGAYLAQLLPLICLGELFLLSVFSSKKEIRVAAVTAASPVNSKKYALIRSLAVITGTLILCTAVVAVSAVFYAHFFVIRDFSFMVLPALLVLLPPVLLCLGLGWFLGRIRPGLLYVAMVLPFALSFLHISQEAELSLYRFFSEYPLSLEVLDPAFVVPSGILLSRVIYSAFGIAMLLFCSTKALQKCS